MLGKGALEKTVKFSNKPIKPGITSTLGTKGKLSKTKKIFGKSTDNNINGKLTQKRGTIQLPAYLPQDASYIKPNK